MGVFADRAEGDVNLSLHRQKWQDRELDEASRALLAEDARWFLHQSMSTPCLNALSSAKGSWLTDLQGRRILDFHGNSVHQIGYAHPVVLAAIHKTQATLPFSPRRYTNAPAVALAKRLCQAAPMAGAKLLLAPSGALAVGMAIKLARLATGRHKTISLWDSFHGASLDAISIGGESTFRKSMGPLMPGTEHAPPHDPGHCIFGCVGSCELRCADYIEYCLAKEGDVAAVIVETIRSTDVQVPPHAYYQRLRKACDRYGALLILDEIPIALGRTGYLFAVERYGIEPDMIVIGKGLGGASMPLAALLARDGLDVGRHVSLGHYTHEKNPVACAAALATLEVIEAENLLERSRTLGAYALTRLSQMAHPMIASTRGAGLLLAVELTDFAGHTSADLAERVLYQCLSSGLSFKIGQDNVIVLAPPLNIAEPDLDLALDILAKALIEVGDQCVRN